MTRSIFEGHSLWLKSVMWLVNLEVIAVVDWQRSTRYVTDRYALSQNRHEKLMQLGLAQELMAASLPMKVDKIMGKFWYRGTHICCFFILIINTSGTYVTITLVSRRKCHKNVISVNFKVVNTSQIISFTLICVHRAYSICLGFSIGFIIFFGGGREDRAGEYLSPRSTHLPPSNGSHNYILVHPITEKPTNIIGPLLKYLYI